MLVVASLEHSVSFNEGESAYPCYYVLITLTAEKDLQCDVFVVIRSLNNWEELGLLDLEQQGRIASCNIEMLSAWLKQQDNERNPFIECAETCHCKAWESMSQYIIVSVCCPSHTGGAGGGRN